MLISLAAVTVAMDFAVAQPVLRMPRVDWLGSPYGCLHHRSSNTRASNL